VQDGYRACSSAVYMASSPWSRPLRREVLTFTKPTFNSDPDSSPSPCTAQVSSETDLELGAGASRRGGAVGRTFEYSLGDATLLLDLALQSASVFAVCHRLDAEIRLLIEKQFYHSHSSGTPHF